MKRNKLIVISVITIAITASITISKGYSDRSKVFMETETYEREEAAEKLKAQPITTQPDQPVTSRQDFDRQLESERNSREVDCLKSLKIANSMSDHNVGYCSPSGRFHSTDGSR